jgi:hypothetical protein
MLIGHLLPFEAFTQLDTKRLDELTKVAMDELVENPVIDEQIRQNQVIMRELSTAIARSLKPNEQRR